MVFETREVFPPEFTSAKVAIVDFESKVQIDSFDILREYSSSRSKP